MEQPEIDNNIGVQITAYKMGLNTSLLK